MRDFVFTGKEYTPNLNEFVKALINDGPDLDQQTLMTVLAIMDETLQDIIISREANENIVNAILAMYKVIEEYFELENEGH